MTRPACIGRVDFCCWACHRRRRLSRDPVGWSRRIDPDLERRFRSPTETERKRELDALRRAADQERERGDNDQTLN